MTQSHFGGLGSPAQRVSPVNVWGAILMVGSVVLATCTR
jgi:hypothetical protein